MVRLMKKQACVWGIEYRFKKKWWNKCEYGKWNPDWTGPIGEYTRESDRLSWHWHGEMAGCPYFFRTRAMARKWVKKRYPKWSACQGRVRKYVLTWDLAEEVPEND